MGKAASWSGSRSRCRPEDLGRNKGDPWRQRGTVDEWGRTDGRLLGCNGGQSQSRRRRSA
jgi:hypothetical protein